MLGRTGNRGFTLIELMIVVAIISVLALVVLPKFGAMVQKSKESSTKGRLGSIRSAIHIYESDNDQNSPATYSALMPRYLDATPPILYTTQHPLSETVDDLGFWDPASDSAHWVYIATGTESGAFGIQCTHTDLSGKIWSTH